VAVADLEIDFPASASHQWCNSPILFTPGFSPAPYSQMNAENRLNGFQLQLITTTPR